MAPFAFLGPQYDEALQGFYTTTTTADVFTERSRMMALMRGDALARTAPLAALLEQYVDAPLLEEVARAHRQGRRLYMGTVDLDTRSFTVWNMGRIAEYGGPQSLALFRKVMLASSSVPIAFPPVLFEVEADGRRYDEMHVDGFVWANVFLHAGIFEPAVLHRQAHAQPGREDIYVIHNGQLIPQPDPIARALPAIAGRVIDATGRAVAIGDLFRIQGYAQHEGGSFRWITLPEDVNMAGDEVFDPVQMQMLYELGHRMALKEPRWLTQLPGLRPDP